MLKANSNLGVPDSPEPKFLQDRPSTPSPMDIDKYKEYAGQKNKPPAPSSDTCDAPSADAVMIEVKPLPKIRLSLMPSPREEDEFNWDDDAEANKKKSADAVMIEVKPLPKIRLSLMPSPREEDEFSNWDDDAEANKKKSSGSTGSKSKRSRKSWSKKRRSRKPKV